MPVIWVTLSFFGGVLVSDQLSWDVFNWLVAGVVCSGLFLIGLVLLKSGQREKNLRLRALIAALVGAFFLGGMRYQASLPDFQDPDYILGFAGQENKLTITGVVAAYPDARDQIINLRLETELLEDKNAGSGSGVNGLILVKVPAESQVSYGDRIQVTGYLKLPPEEEDFNYRAYLKRQEIYAFIPQAEVKFLEADAGGNHLLRVVYKLRTQALNRVYQLWPDPEASLLAGILLGIETGISDQVQKAFRETGTTHIIAISGFNITIIAGLFSRLFSRLLNPRQGALAAGLGICLYTMLVGADAAVLRAAVMGVLSIFARQIGRRQHGINAAALASLIMALINPHIPWDISFQLSLSATLGLILYADPLSGWFVNICSRVLPAEKAQRLAGPVSEYVLLTFAAQLTTLPVMIYHFKSFSLNTFLTNPAILPVQPPIMLVGGGALLLSMIWLPLGKAAALLVYPFVLYSIRVVEWFSQLPIRPSQIAPLSLMWVFVFYALLGILTFGRPLILYFSSQLSWSAVAGGLLVLILLIWRMVFSAPDGFFHFYLLDVGTGNAVYLQSPLGSRIIINGGPSTKQLSDLLGRRMPPFQREVDYWIIASPQEQDLDALAGNILRFRPQNVLWLGGDSICWEAENLRVLLHDYQIPISYGDLGQVMITTDGLRISVLALSQLGGTLLVEYGDFRALLPFGLQQESREKWRLGQDLGEMSALLLADNGYQSSNPSRWIENLRPQMALLSVGIKNSQGLPNRGLMDRLGGYSLLRTDQHGVIQLITDGDKLWVQVERLP